MLPLYIQELMRGLVPQVFTQETFRDAFVADIEEATRTVFIHTPNLTLKGFERLITVLTRKVAQGVRVCVYLEEPEQWYRRDSPLLQPQVTAALKALQANIEALERIQVHVTLRKGLHEKAAVIDYCKPYHGSLNILSWTNKTTETMHRWFNPGLALAMVRHYRLHDCNSCRLLYEPLAMPDLLVDPDQIGRIISVLRKTRGLTQTELAELAGVNRTTIITVESGKRIPTFETLCTLLNVLDRRFVLLSNPALTLHEQIAKRTGPTIPELRASTNAPAPSVKKTPATKSSAVSPAPVTPPQIQGTS